MAGLRPQRFDIMSGSASSVAELLARLASMAKQSMVLWGHSPAATATLINLSENATYRVDDLASAGPLHPAHPSIGYHSKAAINSSCSDGGAGRMPASKRLNRFRIDGSVIQLLPQPDLADPRHAVMFKFMTAANRPKGGKPSSAWRGIRQDAPARHGLTPPTGFTRHIWDYETSLGSSPWGRWQDGMGLTPDRLKLLERLSQPSSGGWSGSVWAVNGSLIHADIRLANLLVEGTRTKVIDSTTAASAGTL
jgi:hypothetical protein